MCRICVKCIYDLDEWHTIKKIISFHPSYNKSGEFKKFKKISLQIRIHLSFIFEFNLMIFFCSRQVFSFNWKKSPVVKCLILFSHFVCSLFFICWLFVWLWVGGEFEKWFDTPISSHQNIILHFCPMQRLFCDY